MSYSRLWVQFPEFAIKHQSLPQNPMSSSRDQLIEAIVTDFSSRHVPSARVFLPRRKADRVFLGELGIPECDPATAPDVVIHDHDRGTGL